MASTTLNGTVPRDDTTAAPDAGPFEPRWRPPFIATIAPEDRCHLNGLAMADGAPKYVTVLAESDIPQGWRPVKATGGCLIDVPSGETVARGFAMPHSPRVHGGRVWVLHSGAGQLVVVDPATGRYDDVAELPGSLDPRLSGPHPELDGGQPIWTVPTPEPLSQADRG